MQSEKEKNEINSNIKIKDQEIPISNIISSTTNFISEEAQQDIPNSEANFILRENKNLINNDKNKKRKIKSLIN